MMLGSVEIETMIYKLSLLIGEIIVGLDSGTIALVNLQTSPGCTINCSFVTNVFRTGPVIEPEKLPVHGSLVGSAVEPLLNR